MVEVVSAGKGAASSSRLGLDAPGLGQGAWGAWGCRLMGRRLLSGGLGGDERFAACGLWLGLWRAWGRRLSGSCLGRGEVGVYSSFFLARVWRSVNSSMGSRILVEGEAAMVLRASRFWSSMAFWLSFEAVSLRSSSAFAWPSVRRMAACPSPSACRIAACFSPSAWAIMVRPSLSAAICRRGGAPDMN